MIKNKQYLFFPLSLLVLCFVYAIGRTSYDLFWLNNDPKGINSMGLVLCFVLLVCTIGLAFLLRAYLKPALAFSLELLLIIIGILGLSIERESLVLALEQPDIDEFVIIYDDEQPERLNWKLSENEVSIFSLPPKITNRRVLTINEEVEVTKRKPSIYLPYTQYYSSVEEDLEYQRSRFHLPVSDHKTVTVDYYSRRKGFEHQDSLLNKSPLLARVRSSLIEEH
ncbi:MAG: hypothetical protein AAF391_09430 [Bacteroidota bacterium]